MKSNKKSIILFVIIIFMAYTGFCFIKKRTAFNPDKVIEDFPSMTEIEKYKLSLNTCAWIEEYQNAPRWYRLQIRYVPADLIDAIHAGLNYPLLVDVDHLYKDKYKQFSKETAEWMHQMDETCFMERIIQNYVPYDLQEAIKNGYDYELPRNPNRNDLKRCEEKGIPLYRSWIQRWVEWYRGLEDKSVVKHIPWQVADAVSMGFDEETVLVRPLEDDGRITELSQCNWLYAESFEPYY